MPPVEPAPQLCRLCGAVAGLVKSHIIPRAFFNIEDDQPSQLISNRVGSFPRRAPIGVYDRIVCEPCERSFSDYDSYAATVLLNALDSYRPIVHEGRPLAYIVPSIDYRLLKLFAVATLWRASVATHVFYSKVKLGRHEELARHLLSARDPGSPNEFSTWWSVFPLTWSPGVMDPFKERWNGIRAYRFYLGRVIAYIKADSQPTPRAFREIALRPGEPLVLMARRFETSNDARAMRAVIDSRRVFHRRH
jgi:hypothetical protein